MHTYALPQFNADLRCIAMLVFIGVLLRGFTVSKAK